MRKRREVTLFLTEKDVASLLSMEIAIKALEQGFIDQSNKNAWNSPRRRINFGNGTFHFMAAVNKHIGVMGMKTYSTFNSAKPKFYTHLLDSTNGHLLAILEANRLGQIRTGAASGIATKYMSNPDASTVGIIGTGYQAETQLEAITKVRSINKVKVYSRNPLLRKNFSVKMSKKLNLDVEDVTSPEECIENMSILVTITSAKTPVLKGQWITDSTHINAAGGNHWLRREIDTETVKLADLVVTDDVAQAKIECADLIYPIENGALDWQRVNELWEIVSDSVPARKKKSDVTLFESQGIALQDIATSFIVYSLAKTHGFGNEFSFEDQSG